MGSPQAIVSGANDPAGQGVDYRTTTPGVCSISSSGTISPVSIGSGVLVADAPGYLLRDEASITKTMTVVAATTTTTSTTTSTTTPPTSIPATFVTPETTLPQGQASVATVPKGATTTIPTGLAQQPVAPLTTSTTIAAPFLAAPTASLGEAGATVDGKAVASQLIRENNALVFSGAGVTATVYAVSQDGSRVDLTNSGDLRLQLSQSIVVEGSGFVPGESVEVWMFSTPTKIGSVTVDPTGNIRGSFALPQTLDSGNHRFVLNGSNKNGQNVTIGIGVAVGEIGTTSTVARVLIAVPVALAIIVAFVLPSTLRRRKKLAHV